MRVELDRAYAPFALKGVFDSSDKGVAPRDRAFATELVYGVLRWRGRIDHILSQFSKRPLVKLTPWTRNALRIGLYQLLFLPSIPHAVACDETVRLVSGQEPWATGFANALLRAYLRGADKVRFPDPNQDPAQYLSVYHSHPHWMVRRWIDRFQFETTEAICQANNRIPPVTIRIQGDQVDIEDVRAKLEARGVDVSPGRLSPWALRLHLKGMGPVESLPGFHEGHFQVQDESSQLVAWVVDPPSYGRTADLCAAPGGKTTHMAALMRFQDKEAKGLVFAYDRHSHRVGLIEENAKRLGLDPWIHSFQKDARRVDTPDDEKFDRVLVDAPCSGTGVLARRPDLRWHKDEKEIPALVQLQREILQNAARLVMPGGFLIYTTCSLEEEENEENAAWFLATHSDFCGAPLEDVLPRPAKDRLHNMRVLLGGAAVQILPQQFETDGFFLFRARKMSD